MNDSIVLINNDNYGAPELKKMSQGYTLKGFIIAVTIHIAFVAAYMLFSYLNEAKADEIPVGKTPLYFVEFPDPPSVDEKEIPLVKEEEVTKPVKDLASLQPQPVAKDIADDVKLKTQDELNNITGNTSSTGDSLIVSNVGMTDITDKRIDDKIETVIKETPKDYNMSEVDVAPECINLGSVRGSMIYPSIAIDAGIEGKVTVKVLVGPQGNIVKVGSISGPDVFHDEVRDKAMNLQFTPGLQSNKPVKVWVTVPFSFKLK